MTTYNTGNAIGSTDPRDLYDNAQAFDEAVNSDAISYTDRLGNVKPTLSRLQDEFPQAYDNAESAATNALIAQNSAATAVSAKTAAEAARDAAQLSAGVYATTAAGLAATTNGRYFSVPSADSLEYLILYLNNAGAAVEQKRYPSVAAVAQFLNYCPPGYQYAIADQDGNIVFTVDDNGGINFKSFVGTSIGIANEQLVNESAYGRAWSIVDSQGGVALAVKTDGTVETNALEANTLNGVSVASIISGGGGSTNLSYQGSYGAEIMGVFSYGQSLSVGADATPPITTTQRFDNLKFAGGVRTQDSATPYTGLVALTETTSGTQGETPIAGMTDAIKERILLENGIAYTAQTYQMLGTAPGAGGTPISGLGKNSGPYNRLIADLTNGKTLANAASKAYKAGAVTWTQGESDYINSTPAATYKAALTQLQADIDSDGRGATGQSESIPFITYQTWAHGTYGYANNPYIAYAQLEVATSNVNFHMATPLYFFRNGAQFVHLTATESKWLGAYYGLVYKRVVIDGKRWLPVYPVSSVRQGAIVLIKFNVPRLPLTLDTITNTLKTNYGFELQDSGGNALTISSVSLVEPDTVKIVAAATIPAGAKVRYGTTGGNLRDSQGDDVVFGGNGLNIRLDNWCVLFELGI